MHVICTLQKSKLKVQKSLSAIFQSLSLLEQETKLDKAELVKVLEAEIKARFGGGGVGGRG